jgi:hypothetical protein
MPILLVGIQSASETCESLRSFPPINLYKSTRRERLNLYGCPLTPDAYHARTSSKDATAKIETRKTQSQRGIALFLG